MKEGSTITFEYQDPVFNDIWLKKGKVVFINKARKKCGVSIKIRGGYTLEEFHIERMTIL